MSGEKETVQFRQGTRTERVERQRRRVTDERPRRSLRPVLDTARQHLPAVRADWRTKVVLALIAGLVIGLVIGWVIWPVEWTGAGPVHMAEWDKAEFIKATAALYAYERDPARAARLLRSWDVEQLVADICALAAAEPDPAERMRLSALVAQRAGVGCKVSYE